MSEAMDPDEIFTCRRCGSCCKGYGGTFVTDQDIDAISRFLNIKSTRFLAEFCQTSGDKPVLAQGRDGYCIFWNKLCTIHPVKPRMCKLWPFIESVMVDVNNWQAMASCCPGIQTNVPDDVITACVRKVISQNERK